MFKFKNDDLMRARQIVSELSFPEEFGMSDEEGDSSEIVCSFRDQLMDILEEDEDFDVSCGISKLVINMDSLPFVIKIPFNGRWIWDWEEAQSYFSPFTEACDVESDETDCDDYCADEYVKICKTQEKGYGMFVPETMFLDRINGLNIYVHEKIIPIFESNKTLHPSKDSLDKAQNYSLSFMDKWIAVAIDLYGEEFWNQFIQWATESDMDILSDMHGGNYGIAALDGRPVMFDVSGFRD